MQECRRQSGKRASSRLVQLARFNKLASQDQLIISDPHPSIDSSHPSDATLMIA